MSAWSFVAYGTPAPQGSKRHVGRGVMIESSKAVKPWREDVKQAALTARDDGAACLDGPLLVRMVFTLRRPKSAPKRLTIPATTPDLSKLARSTEDAITTANLWADDARVADYDRLAKVWTGLDDDALPMPGVRVAAVQIEDGIRCDLELAAMWEAVTLQLRGEVAV
jgi:Holliday junction resolvase RusA-like endonuclease